MALPERRPLPGLREQHHRHSHGALDPRRPSARSNGCPLALVAGNGPRNPGHMSFHKEAQEHPGTLAPAPGNGPRAIERTSEVPCGQGFSGLGDSNPASVKLPPAIQLRPRFCRNSMGSCRVHEIWTTKLNMRVSVRKLRQTVCVCLSRLIGPLGCSLFKPSCYLV